MQDFNFFEPYLDKKRLKIEGKFIRYLIVILLSLSLISYIILIQIKIRRLSDEIAKLEAAAEDEITNRRVDDIRKMEKQAKKLKAALEEVKFIDRKLEEDNIIDDLLLQAITSKMPKDLFFTSMKMDSNGIEIVGIAQDKQTIAELGKSLEMIKEFKEVFISSISKEEIYYKFNLNINLKDVNADEEAEAAEDSEAEENAE
ncbi:MAG TPA: PilN domain-containing protein [Tepidimicrobium sp.]|nr:PilN domain-containing protein [Tepidimicrobium sp.]